MSDSFFTFDNIAILQTIQCFDNYNRVMTDSYSLTLFENIPSQCNVEVIVKPIIKKIILLKFLKVYDNNDI